jgi:hypothetical protein
MTNTTDIWSDRHIEIFAEYAKCNDIGVLNEFSNNMDAYGMVAAIMNDKLSNDLIRERIVAKIENLQHSSTMHNYDAYNLTLNRHCEIKSEQHCSVNGRRNQVTGGGAFGSARDTQTVLRLTNDNPVMYMNAFIDGRMAYNVSFDFNDSAIAIRLINTIARVKLNDVKTAPKFMWSDWCNANSLEVTYLHFESFKKLRQYVSAELMEIISHRWKYRDIYKAEKLARDAEIANSSNASFNNLFATN